MALLHAAEITPTKIELLTEWAPTQPWFVGDKDVPVTNVAAYRFDDPDGQVGIETILVRAGAGPLLQVPLTYRDAPLTGAEASLITTMQHSVLGKRWVYDGTGDPAYLAAVANAALHGGRQAELTIEVDGRMVVREPTAVVAGSGTPGGTVVAPPAVGDIGIRHEPAATVLTAGPLRVVVERTPGTETVFAAPATDAAVSEVIAGTWPGQTDLCVLVRVERLN